MKRYSDLPYNVTVRTKLNSTFVHSKISTAWKILLVVTLRKLAIDIGKINY